MRRFLTRFCDRRHCRGRPRDGAGRQPRGCRTDRQRLRDSGQMSNYKIGVKYQDGTGQKSK